MPWVKVSKRVFLAAFAFTLLMGSLEWSGRAQQQQVPQGSTQRQGERASNETDNRVGKEQLDAWMTELSNWGRWGVDDELGAANLITPEKRREAASLVRTGITASLAREERIIAGAVDNPFGMIVNISPAGFASDRIEVSFHGRRITHLDALCHFSYDGKTYNGYAFEEVVTKEGGCAKLGVGGVKDRTGHTWRID